MKTFLSLLSLLLLTPAAFAQTLQHSPLTYSYPKIDELGKVVRLPAAQQQPRPRSKIVVDLIKGGDPSKLNPGIEKVARFVNIYAGAGARPAEVDIAVVLHGDATLICLKPDVYTERFKCDENPNAECIKKLRRAGVELFVCGQSLVGKGQHPDEVEANVKVAVSALTSLVNLQANGHAYVLLGK
ncbi:DsrE/DsrF-like family protein [Stieleria bergensis]|uniref:DsrE/DsrF-like family protein n=1 Tax=Stieleria bergensis TaxID=2528025 RepID=A0A517T2V8_9BACT|nr:DsrE/DsrF-like family protein [Planctomycetes bacterium SV_7m_r]